jgi:Aminopeptidase P, N-terminal domain
MRVLAVAAPCRARREERLSRETPLGTTRGAPPRPPAHRVSKLLVESAALLFVASIAGAQPPLFADALPKEGFAARRAKVMQQIGDAVVVMQGATETSSYEKFRQSNQFFYLTGVEVPRAILLIDGRAKSSALYIAPRNDMAERKANPWDNEPAREEWFMSGHSIRSGGSRPKRLCWGRLPIPTTP